MRCRRVVRAYYSQCRSRNCPGSQHSMTQWNRRAADEAMLNKVLEKKSKKSRFLPSPSKKSKKNLDSYCFVTSQGSPYDFLSFKVDVNVPSKVKIQESVKKTCRSGTVPYRPVPISAVRCRSGSVRSVSFWASRILPSSSQKKVKKTLMSNV
jgi:hypothetical protein